MAATVLAKDLLWRVSQQLGDVNPQFIKWTERELVNWVNDGQRLIAALFPIACARTDAIKLVPGSKQSIDLVLAANILPGDGSAAADTSGTMLLDVTRNMGANGATPGRAVRVVERDRLDALLPNWHTETADVVEEYVFDPRTPKTFYVYPAPAATPAVWMEVSWLVSPTAIPYSAGSLLLEGASTLKLSIDDAYVDMLVHYILSQAYMRPLPGDEGQGNDNRAITHANLFSGAIKALFVARGDQNPNLQLLPFTPGVPAAAK